MSKKTTIRLDPLEIEALLRVLASAHAGDPDGEPFFGRSALIEASESLHRKVTEAGDRAPAIHLDFGEEAFCGQKGATYLVANEDYVTCSRCLNRIGSQDSPQNSPSEPHDNR